MQILSVKPVVRGEWTFKVSAQSDSPIILMVATNSKHHWTSIRFFNDEDDAKTWADYLTIQGEIIANKEQT